MRLFLIILFKTILNNIIKIPFKMKYNVNDEISVYDYLNSNNPITEILIGTPPQKIKLKIYFLGHPLMISGKETNGSYNKEKSLSYIEIGKTICSSEDYKNLSESKEVIYIQNYKLDNFTFIYPKESINNENESYFGVYINPYQIKEYHLIYQLYKRNIISNNIYIFDYKNEFEGNLIIGDYFHNFDNSYLSENFIQTNNDGYSPYIWNLNFDKISYENIIINQQNGCDINPSFNGIILNKDFQNKIIDTFFKQYIDNGECIINSIKNISYFKCNEKININKFGILSLYHRHLNYIFNLSSNDLFLKKNKKIYFKILLNEKDYNKCVLGIPLIKKYKIIFDYDRKIIGLYTKVNIINSFIKMIILFILILLCIGLIIYIMKKMEKKRKKRINEIDDNYDYITKIN